MRGDSRSSRRIKLGHGLEGCILSALCDRVSQITLSPATTTEPAICVLLSLRVGWLAASYPARQLVRLTSARDSGSHSAPSASEMKLFV